MEGWQEVVKLIGILICVFLIGIYIVPHLKVGFS